MGIYPTITKKAELRLSARKEMKDLFKHVQNVNRTEHLWSQGDTLVLGVSGGSDSMTLLDLMLQCAKKDELTLIVTHVNYGLRGDDSDADEALVKAQCTVHKVRFCVKRFTDTAHKGSEAQWRKQRYDYFEEVRHEHTANHILVGHNANDQAETLLLHLLRGTGLNGLRGMQYHRDNIVRPLLKVDKQQVIAYCKMYDIAFREDLSNRDRTLRRNRIRNELLPTLQKDYNNEIVRILSTTADHIANDYDYIGQMAQKCLPVKMDAMEVVFSARSYKTCHPSLQNMRLHQIISHLQKKEVNFTSRSIAELHKAIMSTKNKHQYVYMKGLKMERKGDTVRLTIKA